MLTVAEALDRAQMLCDAATKAGADAADALYYCNAATSVSMRLGALEDVERSEGQDISLRVFVGQRSASVSTADMDAGELAKLVSRCVAMAREAPEDLAPEDRLFRGVAPDFDLDDGSEADPQALRAAALAVEEAARAVDGVTNSEGGSASHSRTRFALATSHGFLGGYGSSGHSLSASVIAGEGAGMQRDYGWHSAHHLSDLESVAAIGTRAGTRAVARLNPGKAPVGKVPVLFDPRVSGGIVGHLLAAIAGPAIARGTSFLLGKEEQALFDSSILIHDDPHRPRGLRSRAFDGEGLPTAPRDIVTGGKITGWLLDTASAKQLGLQPTGHASRGGGAAGVTASNLHLAAGARRRLSHRTDRSWGQSGHRRLQPRRIGFPDPRWPDRGTDRRVHRRGQPDRHVRGAHSRG
jgi:PmbA protein